MSLLIKNGHVVDPANNLDGQSDVLVQDGRIRQVAGDIKVSADKTIDAADKMVIPGLVDMHTHLREPGREDKETIASGTKAALKGGVTTLLAMPNTAPPIDSPQSLRLLRGLIEKSAQARVLMCAAITKDRRGAELVDFSGLKKEGAAAFSDDGNSVDDEDLMLEAFRRAKETGSLIICHCEDRDLFNHGVVNLGIISTQLGLRGISGESEYRRVERDIRLAAQAGARVHIAHVSCKESVEIIRRAKAKGAAVTAETAPHYFSLDQEAVLDYNTNMKINPPLREKEDVEALKQGLKDGVIDCIASDHAPHTESEKEVEFEYAAFGTTGLETQLSASITALIAAGVLSWRGLVEKLALNPARILGTDKGTLGVGRDADIVIVDARREWPVSKNSFVSKSKNSCFIGRRLRGVVEQTILGGEVFQTRIGNIAISNAGLERW